MLGDQIRALAERATRAGVVVSYTQSPDMIHVFQLLRFAASRSQCPQPRESLARVAAFILRHLGAVGSEECAMETSEARLEVLEEMDADGGGGTLAVEPGDLGLCRELT